MFRKIGWGWLVVLVLVSAGAGQEKANEKPILVLDAGGHTSAIRGLAFTPDGKELISFSGDHSVRFWNVATGELARILRLPVYAHTEGQLALSPNGKLLAVGLANFRKEHGIALISLPESDALRHLTGDMDAVWCLAFSPDGKRLASGHKGGKARIWDVAGDRCEQVLEGHRNDITGIVFSPDGKRVATCSADGTGRIWDVESGKEEVVLEDKEVRSSSMWGIAWSPDGKTVVTGCLGNPLRIWHLDGAVRERHNLPTARSILFTKDSKALLYAGTKGGHLFDLEEKKARASCAVAGEFTWSSALSPDERIAATGGIGGENLYLWSTADGRVIHRLAGAGRSPKGAAWSPDGKSIGWGLTVAEDFDWFRPGCLHLRHPLERSFNLTELEFGPKPGDDWRRSQPTSGALSVEVAIKGNSTGGFLNVKDESQIVATLQHYWSSVCTFLPGERIAVGGPGMTLYRARTGEVLRKFNGAAYNALSPSPDNDYLLAPRGDQTLRIWKVDRDDPLLALFFAGDEWIAWTPEGYYAASPGGEKLMGWQINNGSERFPSFYPAAQFHKSLYRPDAIKLLLRTGSIERALEVADATRGIKTGTTEVGDVLPPKVWFLAPAKNLKVADAALEIRARASSTGKNPITAMQLHVDGRPLQGQAGLFRVESPKLGEVDASWKIVLTPGKHRLTVRAESAVSSGLSDEVEVSYASADQAEQGKNGNLYVLTVGISEYAGNLKLKYAAKDAQTLAKAFQDCSKSVFDKIEVKELTDQKATQREILKGITWMSKQMTQRDVGIVFLAGHGELAGNGAFYFLPADVDPDDIAASGVHAEQLKTMLAAVPGRVIFLLDACHAGGFGKNKKRAASALTDDLIRDLAADERGIIVMSAATGRQFALESEEHRQGMFTQALVEGLQGKAKLVDGQVYLHHLDAYVTDRVRELSRGQQSPTTARPASIRSFPLSRPTGQADN